MKVKLNEASKMQPKMCRINGIEYEIIKEGLMVKRSQNKSILTIVNYKERWFVLTKTFLIYFENSHEWSLIRHTSFEEKSSFLVHESCDLCGSENGIPTQKTIICIRYHIIRIP